MHQAIHATSATRLEKIRQEHFRIGANPGRRGPGVYFWHKGPYWEKTGRTWHRQAATKGDYRGDEDLRCAIVHVGLEAPDHRYLDFEAEEARQFLDQLILARNLPSHLGKREINDLWVAIIRLAEKILGTKIAYFRIAIELPNCGGWYPFFAIGNPIAFVVRDLSAISISDYKIYDEAFNE